MKKIYLSIISAVAIATMANAQTLITFQVNMAGATLGANTAAGCLTPAFDPSTDVVEIMGQDVNNWSAPESVACGAPFIADATVDFTEISPGSGIYERTMSVLAFTNAGDSPYKFRINHSWDNDELRGVGDGNRHIAVTPGNTYLITQDFNVDGQVVTNITGLNEINSTYNLVLGPNPVTSNSKFILALTKNANVSLNVFDVVGKLVSTVVSSDLNAGNYEFTFTGTNSNGVQLNSGVYFYSLSLDGTKVKTDKVYIVK